MKDHVERASLELSSEGICDIIAFCCAVGSMMDGSKYDQEIIRRIEETSGEPAIRKLGIKDRKEGYGRLFDIA